MVSTDVTSQKRDAEERERLLQDAEQAVADREHVLAVVSHELRNPLSTIGLAAAVLRNMVGGPEAGQKSSASIMLDLSSVQAGRLAIDPRPLAPRSVVEETVESFEAEAAERGLTLTPEIEDGLGLAITRGIVEAPRRRDTGREPREEWERRSRSRSPRRRRPA